MVVTVACGRSGFAENRVNRLTRDLVGLGQRRHRLPLGEPTTDLLGIGKVEFSPLIDVHHLRAKQCCDSLYDIPICHPTGHDWTVGHGGGGRRNVPSASSKPASQRSSFEAESVECSKGAFANSAINRSYVRFRSSRRLAQTARPPGSSGRSSSRARATRPASAGLRSSARSASAACRAPPGWRRTRARS
jgi:hypothetical protein